LHIEAYHSTINNWKEEKKQRIKIPKEIYKNYKENSEKSVILLKEKETLTYHQHGRLMQNLKV